MKSQIKGNQIIMKLTSNQLQPQQQLKKYWLLFISLGIILIILGIAALAIPSILAIKLTTLIGWVLLVAGLIQMISAWWLKQLLRTLNAMLYLGIGILLLATPIQGAFTLMLLLALFFGVEGIFEIVMALNLRSLSNWSWLLASGIIAVILSIIVVSTEIWLQPQAVPWFLGVFVGINLIPSGMAIIQLARAAHLTIEPVLSQKN